MNVEFTSNEGTMNLALPEEENGFWKGIAENLLKISIPNHIHVDTPLGHASFTVKKRGTYVSDGVEYPSMYVVEDINTINLPRIIPYKDAYMTCIHPESNNYKYYWFKPRADGLHATYGRIGSERGEPFGTKDLQNPYPLYLYWIRYYEKISKGYVDQSDVYLRPKVKKKEASDDSENASYDNSVSSLLWQELLSYSRQIVKKSLVSMEVTKEQALKARQLYDKLCKQDTVDEFNNILSDLLTVSPRKARYIETMYAIKKSDFSKILQREESLVSSMEAIALGTDAEDEKKEVDDPFKAHGVEIYDANDKQKEKVMKMVPDQLKKKYKITIYRVINRETQRRFDEYLKKCHEKKVLELWHGSRNENWLSIIINGLLLVADAIHTGRMFGDALYLALSGMKSWGYASMEGTYWAHGTADVGFMAIYAVAYGKPYDTYAPGNYTQSFLDAHGCDCVHAHAGRYLRNDEIMVYTEAAVTINYLVKFEKK